MYISRIVCCLDIIFIFTCIINILQASTSELYGKVQEIPQKETTPFYPRSPYGKYTITCLLYFIMIINYKLIIILDIHT